MHLTLKFLGPISEDQLQSLAVTMTEVACTHAAPMMHIGSVGAFPNFRRPHVIWIGVAPDPRLELLHHDVEVACAKLGHELDGRPFRPHLTLGRWPETNAADEVTPLRTAAKKVRFTDEFLVQSIDVMESVPGAAGSTYSVLSSAPMIGERKRTDAAGGTEGPSRGKGS